MITKKKKKLMNHPHTHTNIQTHTYTQMLAENTAFSNIESIRILATIINL